MNGKCEQCEATYPTHNKWGKIRAHDLGWYLMRDGREFCPQHRPTWAPRSWA